MRTTKPMKILKNNYLGMKSCIVLFLLLFMQNSQSQTTVSSLADLLPYLDDDNANVKLAPGTYSISSADIAANTFSNPLLVFEGSNSTYDFTGVTLNIDTDVFTAFGSVEVKEIQILGNDNVLKNLTMVDIGDTAPSKRAQSITMDGSDNRVEGFHLTVRGSYPYGYGDSFGKGGGSVISHRKHSAILVRGLRSHLKNTTVISRSYGHCVYMQAASYPTIEGCYIEGETRTTDDMLSETSGPAYDVAFMTVWGYTLPSGYMMSLQEAGIRAYNAGATYIDGVEILRGTDNPTVINCTIKNTRTGVTLAHASGSSYVENCTVIGCEQGYSIGNGTIVNSGADAVYGPVYKNAYASDNGYIADITVLEPSDDYYNGHDALAYVGGTNHDLTFRGYLDYIPSNLKIMVAGDLQGLRVLNGSNASQNNHTVSNVNLKNLTNFPVVMHSDCSNTTIETCNPASVTNNGSNNTVSTLNCDVENLALIGVASQISTAYSGDPNRAIDGDTNGSYNGGSVTHTASTETAAWWQVDMGTDYFLSDIVIHNRTGGTIGERLSDFTVYVIDSDGNTTFSQAYNSAPNPSITIDVGDAYGQIVKVVLDKAGPLSLAEVEVFKSSNLALSGVASQISTAYSGDASRAIDNNTNGNYNGGNSVTHTSNSETAAWWQVDLGAEKHIGNINIFNRTGGNYGNRLSDFTVSVIDFNGNTTFSQVFTSAPNPSITVDVGGALGKIVKVQLNVSGPLSLAEVQVFESSSSLKNGVGKLAKIVDEAQVVSLYPNPTSDNLTISFKETDLNIAETTIVLFNMSGQKILTAKPKNSETIVLNLSNLDSGIYIVKLSDSNTNITHKIIRK